MNISLYKKEKTIAMGVTESQQYSFLMENTVYKKIELTKTTARNFYKFIINKNLNNKISLTKNNINKIVKILDTLKRLKFKNYKAFLLDYIIHQYQGDIEIIDINKKILISQNMTKTGTYYNLPCNPFKNYGECSVIKNSEFHYVKYSPNYKFFIEADFPINAKQIKKEAISKIINLLKTFPEIIIFYNKKQIAGKIKTDSFYVFDKIKNLNIFFGYGVKYDTMEQLSDAINREVLIHIKPLFFDFVLQSILIIIIFYLILFTLFKKYFRTVEIALNEYEKKALIDKLTEVFNRRGFEKAVENCNFKYFILIDLDNFKYINDSFGHEMGDMILKEFAQILKKYFKNDIIGRWGGDEFIVCTNKEKKQLLEIFDSVNKNLAKLQQNFDKKMEKKLSTSVGICDKCGLDIHKRFTNADLALYKVKKTKKGNVLFYSNLDYVKFEKKDLCEKL